MKVHAVHASEPEARKKSCKRAGQSEIERIVEARSCRLCGRRKRNKTKAAGVEHTTGLGMSLNQNEILRYRPCGMDILMTNNTGDCVERKGLGGRRE